MKLFTQIVTVLIFSLFGAVSFANESQLADVDKLGKGAASNIAKANVSKLNEADEAAFIKFEKEYQSMIEQYRSIFSTYMKKDARNRNHTLYRSYAFADRFYYKGNIFSGPGYNSCSKIVVAQEVAALNALMENFNEQNATCKQNYQGEGLVNCGKGVRAQVQNELSTLSKKRAHCAELRDDCESRHVASSGETKNGLESYVGAETDITEALELANKDYTTYQNQYNSNCLGEDPPAECPEIKSKALQAQIEVEKLYQKQAHLKNIQLYEDEGLKMCNALTQNIAELDGAIYQRQTQDANLQNFISSLESKDGGGVSSNTDVVGADSPGVTTSPSGDGDTSNWVTWGVGAGIVGGLALWMKKNRDDDKDKERAQAKLIEDQQAAMDAAAASVEEAEACAQPGSENFPGCEGYLVTNCQVYYGEQYAPFSLVDEPSSSATEVERVEYEAQSRISSSLQTVCGSFSTTYCGTEDEPSSNAGGDFCQAMSERAYCLTSGNTESPTCVVLANQSNPICISNPSTCEADYSEAYLASVCSTYTEDPICVEYTEQQIAAGNNPDTEADVDTGTTDDTTTADATTTNPYYGQSNGMSGYGQSESSSTSEVIVVSSMSANGGEVAADIAPANSTSNLSANSQAHLVFACELGQVYACAQIGR